MKKIIVLLSIICIGFVTVLAQNTLENKQRRQYECAKNIIYVSSQFEKNPEVNKLLEYCASVDAAKAKEQNNNYEVDKDSSNIYVTREGGITQINLHDIDNETYHEVVEKIERVLGLEGLVTFAYDESTIEKEKLLLVGMKEEYKSIYRIAYYEQAIATMGTTKETDEMGEIDIKRSLYLQMPSETLKDVKYAALAKNLLQEGYYVSEMITGEEKDLLVIANTSSLIYVDVGAECLNAAGEIEILDTAQIRYEILADNGQAEEVRMIIKALDEIRLNEVDKEVFKNAVIEMGLDEDEVTEVVACLEETIENPTKDQSHKIGKWQYYSKYTTDRDSYNPAIKYVEIGLIQAK